MTATAPETALQASYELLDPAEITVWNIRDAAPDKGLITSIRENGVLQPVRVLRTPEGELVLLLGARRRLACIEIGCQLPAIVVDGTDRDEIERIFQQLDENDKREPLTAADRATAVQELFDLGVSQRQITHKTGLDAGQLAAARKVAASDTARTLAAQYPLDLEQTAAITEFEDDPAAVTRLITAAEEGSGAFAHVLQRARDDQADAAAIAAHTAKLAAKGIKVSTAHISYENAISSWADSDGNQLTEKTHKSCPGNVVTLAVHGYNSKKVHESWYCTDPRGHGHKKYRSSSGGNDPTPDERRQVLAGNKAWRSAETVRRDWLRKLLARPKVPDGGLLFTLEAFARSGYELRKAMEHRMDGTHGMARELLGLSRAEGLSYHKPPEVHAAMTNAGPARAQVIALAIALGAVEASTGVHSWRHADHDTAEYLEALADWGYPLSEIESQLVATARERETEHTAVIQQDEAAAAEHDDPDEDQADE